MNISVRPDPGPHYDSATRFQAEACADLADVRGCREIIRNALLSALSEIRDKSRSLEVASRDKFLDRITAQFNPNADVMRDLFADAFAETEGELIDMGAS